MPAAPETSSLRGMLRFMLSTALFFLLTVAPAPFSHCQETLSSTGRANLEALARLLSVVRYFHPSDQAASVDWNRFTSSAIARVEVAPDPVALAALLQGIIRSVGPTVQVFPLGREPELPTAWSTPEGTQARLVAWRHFGLGLDGKKPWSSERVDEPTAAGFAQLSQTLDATGLAGQRVRLSAQVRADLEPGASAELWLRVDRGQGQTSRLERMTGGSIRDDTWRRYEVATDLEPEATTLSLGLLLTGGGRVWLDDVELSAAESVSQPLANPGFELGEPGLQPVGWDFPYSSIRAGYRLATRDGASCRSGRCAEIEAGPIATPRFELPASVTTTALGAGVGARVPWTLWADERGTLPHGADAPTSFAAASPRSEELAAVVLAWGAARQFFPYFEEVGVNWEAALPDALDEMALAAVTEERVAALERLVARLGDAHAHVGRRGTAAQSSLPLAWEWIEGKLLVTAVESGETRLRVGDEVVAFEGVPIAQRLAELETRWGAPRLATRRARALEALSFGPSGVQRTLTVKRSAAGRPEETEHPIQLAYLRPYDALPLGLLEPVTEMEPGILYLDLRRITDDDLPRLLSKLERARGLVMDLRGSPGISNGLLAHLVKHEVSSSLWNIPVRMRPFPTPPDFLTTFWNVLPKQPHFEPRLAFLIDERAWGFAESQLGLVEASQLGALVGAPTAGNNGNLISLGLPGELRVSFTGMKVTRQDGSRFHGLGVRPTVPATRTVAGLRAGRDEVIEAGLAAVR